MEALIALVIGVLTAGGVFLALRGQTFPVVLGLTFLSYAVNLFIFVMGRLAIGVPPVISDAAAYTDPLPQALVLTAIVIGFALLCFALVLGARLVRDQAGSDPDALRAAEPAPTDPVKPAEMEAP